MDSSYTSPTTRPIFRAAQVVWYLLGIIETILVFRFALKLLGANIEAGFTSLVYGLSTPLVMPFQAVFRTPRLDGSAFEWTTLLAMFVYWLLAVGVMQLLLMSKSVSTREAAQNLDREEV